MTTFVAPNDDRNTHHLMLTDQLNYKLGLILCNPDGSANPRAFQSQPIIRTAIKMYQNEQRLSDLEPPWQDVVMDDFGGGRGGLKYEDDSGRYWDGYGINTIDGHIMLAPMPIFDRGTAWKYNVQNWPVHRFSVGGTPATTGWERSKYQPSSMLGDYRSQAVQFTAGATTTLTNVMCWAKGNVGEILSVMIHPDAAGEPGAILGTAFISLTPDMQLRYGTFSCAIVSGNVYWISFNCDTSADATILCNGTADPGATVKHGALGLWTNGLTDGRPWFYTSNYTAGLDGRLSFAQIKNSTVAAIEHSDGTVSRVFSEGAVGTPTSVPSTDQVRDTNNAARIVDDAFNAGILKIISGQGSHIPSPWAPILDTLTANSEILAYGLPIAPNTNSEYCALGTDRWYEITGHGLGAGNYFSDAEPCMGAIYFGCGPSVVMRRLRHFFAAGTYWQWTNETGYGTLLKMLTDGGTSELWIANRTLPGVIQRASTLDCTGAGAVAALTFANFNCGDSGQKVTNLGVYGEDFPQLYVFKEGSIYRIIGETAQELRISGMDVAADERNGYGYGVHGVYLYFSFLDTIQRYYSGSLDNTGMDKDADTAVDKRGLAAAFASYPNALYAVIDGGPDSYSQIVANNGRGWHEVWRTPATGQRMYGRLHIAPMPGDSTDRLYSGFLGAPLSLGIDVNPFNVNSKTSVLDDFQPYLFGPAGALETSWIHLGLENVDKLFNKVTVMGENLSSTYSKVYLDYKVDDATGYTPVGQITISGDQGSISLKSAMPGLVGKRIRLRIRLETLYNNSTPRINAIILEALAVQPSKQRIDITFKLEDNADTLVEEPDDIPSADVKLAKLREWAATAEFQTMNGHVTEVNGKKVKIDYPSLQVLRHTVMEIGELKRNLYICQIGAWVIE